MGLSRAGVFAFLFGLIASELFNAAPVHAQEVTVERIGAKVLLAPLSQDAPDGNAGVFVGVNEFQDNSLSRLSFAVNDAVEQAHLFVTELKLLPAANCQLLLGGKPSGESVERHLSELKSLGAKVSPANSFNIYQAVIDAAGKATAAPQMLIVSFSTHGFEERGDAYIMPNDGLVRRLERTAVQLRAIEEDVARSKAGHRLLLVDACQERLSGERSATAVTESGKPMGAAFEEALKLPTGQTKFASCSAGQVSNEAPGLGGVGHGIFTFALLDALRGGVAPDANGLVRLGAVSEHVSQAVSAWVREHERKPQSPFLAASVEGRKLPLAEKGSDLAALSPMLKRRVDGLFTQSLCNQLDARLKMLRLDATDRELLAETRKFAAGQTSSRLFTAFLKEALASSTPAPIQGPPALAIAPFDATVAKRHQQAWADHLRVEVITTNSIGMKMALLPAGRYTMGGDQSPEDVARIGDSQAKFYTSEHPQHTVTLSKAFCLSVFEVTQAEYEQIMGGNPSYFSSQGNGKEKVSGLDTRRFPVENVTWFDAVEFCNKLSQREGLPSYYSLSGVTRDGANITAAEVQLVGGKGYRLPTEAEWEFACRAGTATPYHFGASLNGDRANVNGNYPYGTTTKGAYLERTTTVGSYAAKAAHGFGLCDMHGNVWEWCQDFKGDYASAAAIDPTGPSTGSDRMLRGGSWDYIAPNARAAARNDIAPGGRNQRMGFRAARTPVVASFRLSDDVLRLGIPRRNVPTTSEPTTTRTP